MIITIIGVTSNKVVKRFVKLKILKFYHLSVFVSISLIWDHMRVKFSNNISYDSTHQIDSHKMYA